jgi:hypothetical protein
LTPDAGLHWREAGWSGCLLTSGRELVDPDGLLE